MTEEIIDILKEVKHKIKDDSDMACTKYDSAMELREELQMYIEVLKTGNVTCIENIKALFLPTGSLQEHSISNGWTKEYLLLSEKLDLA